MNNGAQSMELRSACTTSGSEAPSAAAPTSPAQPSWVWRVISPLILAFAAIVVIGRFCFRLTV